MPNWAIGEKEERKSNESSQIVSQEPMLIEIDYKN